MKKLKKETIKKKITTSLSLSDNQVYPQACIDASIDYTSFNSFKRNKSYNEILEHVTESQGHQYLEIISKNSDIMKKIDVFKENDKVGNPVLYDYPEIGLFSPTTLRYIKVLVDIEKLFKGFGQDNNICEIGVGYGGQCRIFDSYYSGINQYYLVDIQPVLLLTQRYLDHYILNTQVIYRTSNELAKKSYDMVISNYAFTELSRELQDKYLKTIILNSKRGYITYNEINPLSFNSYKAAELVSIIPNSKIIAEEPLTHSKNCIIVWGTS